MLPATKIKYLSSHLLEPYNEKEFLKSNATLQGALYSFYKVEEQNYIISRTLSENYYKQD